MEKSAIRVDVGVAAALRAMTPEQRLGMKGHWAFTCMGPAAHDKAEFLRRRAAASFARGRACQILRSTGRDLVGTEVRVTSAIRLRLHRAWWVIAGKTDPAESALRDFRAAEAWLREIPLVEKWKDTIDNIVVNAGLNHILDVVLSAATQVTAWYIGLLSATPTVAAGDTMASHAGWTEVTAYDEANRQAFTEAGASSQSLSNTASPAVFTISTNGTQIGGAFLTSNNTKGGTTGTLYAAGAFTAGNKDLDDGDTIDVTLTATAAAA